MGNNKKEHFDVSDLGASLPAAAAALSAEDRVGLVNALKDKLQNLAGQHSDVLENLSPVVRKRVEVLREIQRYDIVNGVEVGVNDESPMDADDKSKEGT
ncbi:hypothetical protein SSX86_032520 [Deinandra increscens subsp. villosa]|uniref:Uncharacterized protein n=1 Tax=Deinandra increscens subsp. villosa TaxID=3103831 RepID=A0AAP0C746_9ASTR